MSLSAITIKDESGRVLAVATGSLCIDQKRGNAQDTNTVSGSCSDDVATIWTPYFTNIFEEAFNAFFDGSVTCLQTVNGVRPTDDGAFFIEGSDCVSWSYAKPVLDSDSVSEGSLGGNLLAITDLCPSCDVCDKVLELKKAVEYYKLIYNGFKDVILYPYDTTAARFNALVQHRLPVPAQCDAGMDSKYTRSIEPKTIQMRQLNKVLAGYMRTVRMWNWAVSQNARSVEISTTPESDTGFYIQTKYALPNCGDCSSLQLEIDVNLVDGQSNLSVYMPTTGGKKCVVVSKPFDDAITATETVTEEATHKHIVLNFGPPSKAVTHIVRVKFLPFSQNILTLENGRDLVMSSLALQSGDTVTTSSEDESEQSFVTGKTVYYMKPRNEQITTDEPTDTDYKAYSVYPSKTSDGYNTWEINITWTWGQPSTSTDMTYPVSDSTRTVTQQTQENAVMARTFTFQTTRVREYMEGVLLDSDLKDLKKQS
jgi:hypothetical protein